MDEDLKTLRQQVKQLDEQLLRLIAERQAVVRRIGARKHAAKLPIKDYQVEKEVIAHSRRQARELGLYESLATDVTRLLIKYSVQAQDEYGQKRQYLSQQGRAQKILIAGGRGRMGHWLSEFFAAFGHAVSHYDPSGITDDGDPYPLQPDFEAAARQHDVIILATPISATPALITSLLTAAGQSLVFDVCSLKTPLRPAIATAVARGLRIASVHPMFGPQAEVLADRNIIICDAGHPEAAASAEALFLGSSANLVRLPLERHDELMGYVLGLSHLSNLVFALTVAGSGEPFAELSKVSSTTFETQLGVTAPVVNENQDLYFEIQADNQHTPKVIAAFRTALDAYDQAITAGDRGRFKQLMESSRQYLSTYFSRV